MRVKAFVREEAYNRENGEGCHVVSIMLSC